MKYAAPTLAAGDALPVRGSLVDLDRALVAVLLSPNPDPHQGAAAYISNSCASSTRPLDLHVEAPRARPPPLVTTTFLLGVVGDVVDARRGGEQQAGVAVRNGPAAADELRGRGGAEGRA